jgi:dihydroorotase
MPQVMSKFLCLGMSLRDVIAKTTVAPANVLGRGQELGSLRPGSVADLLQFRLREGSFTFIDIHRLERRGNRIIEPLLTIRNGIAYEPGSVAVTLRPIYPCDGMVFDNA